MPWLVLFCAGLCEITWAAFIKQSEGFSRLWPSVATIVSMVLSVILLGRAMRDIPLGSAYAVWTGIGAVGAVLVGYFFFGEPLPLGKIICVAFIVTGIVGLKLMS